MKRRQALQALGSVVLGWPLAARAAEGPQPGGRKVLLFSRSALYEHSVIQRHGNELSFAEKIFVTLARQAGCAVECTKDGRVFEGDLSRYAAVVTYSCGHPADLMKPASLDHSPPLSERGWKNLDASVRGGLPLVGVHPGIWFLPQAFGADCFAHGGQQAAKMLVSSPRFPGTSGLGPSFSLFEEWFSLIQFAKDLHVVLVQDCAGMSKAAPLDRSCYDRPPFPATWARRYGKARVFYTSMGHREDVWTNPIFQQIIVGGLSWTLGRFEADITPNIEQVAPQANDFRPPPK
jgi:type 1 glutamine amidotransferase